MTGYRPIQPAPERGPKVQTAASPDRSSVRKVRQTVSQACQACRKAKIKCDAVRPTCGPCIAKSRPCEYKQASSPGQSGRDVRLELLEQLFLDLRTSPPDQADAVLRRVRAAGHDLLPLLQDPRRPDEGASGSQDQSSAGESPSDLDSRRLSGEAVVDRSTGSCEKTSSTSLQQPSQSPCSRGPWVLSREVVRRAVDGFFTSSGKIFHVFTFDQAVRLDDIVFGTANDASGADEVALCSLMSVAAVGAQYVVGAVKSENTKNLYNCAKLHLDTVIEQKPFEAIKVCTLLSMYNIMDKATVSLAYIETGLSICRQYRLEVKRCQQPGMSQETWDDYRRAWRTLLFLSSWLSSTLGYISGNDVFCTDGLRPDLDHPVPADACEAIQNEMVKIAFLKANMLRVHLAFKEITAPAITTILGELEDWHKELPDELRLGHPAQTDLSLEASRSLSHMHLLHQGAIMLLYRRVTSQYTQAFGQTGHITLWKFSPEMVARLGRKAHEAARVSSDILGRLLEERGIFKRCWLIIFQAYTSCVILLHSVAQRQARNSPQVTYVEDEVDLEKSRVCLSVLSFCGAADPVARKFGDTLRVIHDKLLHHSYQHRAHNRNHIDSVTTRAALPSTTAFCLSRTEIEKPWSAKDVVGGTSQTTAMDDMCLFRFPWDADRELIDLSVSLLAKLCQPFGDPAEEGYEVGRQTAESNVKENWRTDPTRYEYPQIIERLEWDLETRVPIHWDLESLCGPSTTSSMSQGSSDAAHSSSSPDRPSSMSVEHILNMPDKPTDAVGETRPDPSVLRRGNPGHATPGCVSGVGGRFLGSMHPSGWASADRMVSDR